MTDEPTADDQPGRDPSNCEIELLTAPLDPDDDVLTLVDTNDPADDTTETDGA